MAICVSIISSHRVQNKFKIFAPGEVQYLTQNQSTPAHKHESAPLNADVLMVSDQRPHLNPGQRSREHLGFGV